MKKEHFTYYKSHAFCGFLLGCATGAIFFFLIYGAAIINPTYVDWLLHSDDLEGSIDLTQHYLGWVFYRNTPWQFPFGLTKGIYSSPVSVIYTDSIPLFALIFKVLSPLLPETFQYFGIYGFMCYCLTGGFCVLLIRRHCDSLLYHLLSAIIFVSNPVLLNRMFLHTALAGHFLILAGLCLYFYGLPEEADKAKDGVIRVRASFNPISDNALIVLWSLLIAAATLINAYFTPMLYGLLFFFVLSKGITKKHFSPTLCALLISPAALTGILTYCMGMFYGNVPATAGGLEVLSFNLNGFFNPLTKLTNFHDHNLGYKDMVYSKWLPPLSMSTAYQNEGFSYLGVGVIILLLFAILIALSKPMAKELLQDENGLIISSGRRSLLIFAVICLLLSLSPVATLGESELYHLNLPELIHDLWSSFRSTARFIWVVYYLLITMVLMYVGRYFQKDKISVIVHVIVFAAVIIQLLDLSPGFIEKHGAFDNIAPYSSKLSDPKWNALSENASKIIFYPPTEYGLYEDGKTSVEFEIYALYHGLSLNNSYMSRNLCDFADRDTLSHFETIASGASYPDEIYVFFDNVSKLPDPSIYHLNYYKLNGYTVAVNAD